MATIHFSPTDTPLTQYLQAGLVRQGHSLTSRWEEADIGILSLYDAPMPSSDGNEDAMLGRIQGLSQRQTSLQKLVVLSSPSIYGEGDFLCGDCGPILNHSRGPSFLQAHRWEVHCPICGELLMPAPIPESSQPKPISRKGHHIAAYEQALVDVQSKLPYPIIRLRLFYPYWPEQSFLNPENSGVVAAVCRALLSNQSPMLFEDGYQMRDLTHGEDILQAIEGAIQRPIKENSVYNIGSGQQVTLLDMTAYLQEFLRKTDIPYTLTERFREGDARHRLADISSARHDLGYEPRYGILNGLEHLAVRLLSTLTPVH